MLMTHAFSATIALFRENGWTSTVEILLIEGGELLSFDLHGDPEQLASGLGRKVSSETLTHLKRHWSELPKLLNSLKGTEQLYFGPEGRMRLIGERFTKYLEAVV